MTLAARLAITLFALAAALAPQWLHAQSWPSKPIRMIVPYPPGGIDPYARIMLPKMSELLGQPIILENRAGANGIIGTDAAVRAAPDGYTILFATSSTLVGGVLLIKDVHFDPVKDLTPISNMFENLRTITIFASLPIRSLPDLIDYARRNPGKLSYASSGIGSTFHFDGEILKSAAGIDIVHVPYKGTGPMATDLAAGRIEVGIASYVNVQQFVNSGKLRLLAVMEKKRHSLLPDVPTVAETLPGVYKSPAWVALLAPAGLPRPMVARFHDAAIAALEAPDVKAFHHKNATVVSASTPEELTEDLKTGLATVGKLMRQLDLKPE